MQLILTLFLLLLGNNSLGDSKTITGQVIDSQSNTPVPFTYIHIEELNRTATTDIDGYFEITNMPSGNYQLAIHRLGYKSKHVSITIEDNGDEISIEIYLTPTLLSSQAIEVSAQQITSGAHLTHSSKKLFGDELRQQLGTTLAQTLSNMPGISQRTMGNATGRPVIRGLGDERLTILEDGINSGDISAQSSDHAVTIEASSAQEVEIARGPAALAYGANAVAGIVNVVNNKISSTLPNKVSGSFSLTGESVNTGGASALSISAPFKSFAINANLNGRTALDTDTPLGKIKNTYINSYSTSIGASYIKNWGYIGGSFAFYKNEYGIPPDPNGHPEGVDIDMEKFQYVLKLEYVFRNSFLTVWETDFSLNNYHHVEFESNGSVGTEFGVVTTNVRSNISHGSYGFLENGNFGISFQMEDYAVNGAETPNSNSYSVGAFLVEEKDFRKLHLEAGLRFDHVMATTDENDLFYKSGAISGAIDSTYYKNRSFSAISSSFSGIYSLKENINIGATILHSFRAPSLEELYSEGPHLASYSFEIGNPDLKAERGLAKEIFVAYNNSNTIIEAALYHNNFTNYLYAQNTGIRNSSNPDLNNYQFVGVNARLYGFEITAEQQLFTNFVLRGSLNYTVGRRDASDAGTSQEPLPQIPPMSYKGSIKYAHNNFEIGTRISAAAAQKELGEFETYTAGYVLFDGFATYRLTSKKLLHTLSFNATNLLNETYYNHLSRIKDFNPEPGRNFSLLYRLYF